MAGKKRFSWDLKNDDEGASSAKKATPSQMVSPLAVSDLEPGMIRDRALRIRVTYSGEAHLSRDGKTNVHNFTGIGSDGKEISFVSFGDKSKLLEQILVENKVFSIEKFEVKTSPLNYIKCGNPLEVHLKHFTDVSELDNLDQFPAIPFNFKTLEQALEVSEGDLVDLLAVVVEDWGVEEVEVRGSRMAKRRQLTLTDKTKKLISFVLWGKVAECWSGAEYSVVAVRNSLVSFFELNKIVQFSSRFGTYIQVNPSTDEANDMREWFTDENEVRMAATSE